MYNASIFLHSLLRWVILLLSLIAIFRSYAGMSGGKPFTAGDKKIGLFLMISAHIELLIGLYQWITGPMGLQNIRNMGMDAVMKDPASRFYAVEHITGMLIAVVLITIGHSRSKKAATSEGKHKAIAD